MRRGRRDANHGELSELFKALGCSWVDLTDTGIPGWPDGACGLFNVTHLVEIKSKDSAYGRSGLNPNQAAFYRDWKGEKPYVVSTPDEVVALVNSWRQKR